MTLLEVLALSPLILAAHANHFFRQDRSIDWEPCADGFSLAALAVVPVECATLEVPLDYTQKTSSDALELQLIRVKATKEPAKVSILFMRNAENATSRFEGSVLLRHSGHGVSFCFPLIVDVPSILQSCRWGIWETHFHSCSNHQHQHHRTSASLTLLIYNIARHVLPPLEMCHESRHGVLPQRHVPREGLGLRA